MVFTLTNETLMHNETDLATDVDIKLINHMPTVTLTVTDGRLDRQLATCVSAEPRTDREK